MLVFGGSLLAGSELSNEVHAYTLDTGAWQRLWPPAVGSPEPTAVTYRSTIGVLVCDEQRMLVFGGYCDLGTDQADAISLTDVFEFTFARRWWRQVVPEAEPVVKAANWVSAVLRTLCVTLPSGRICSRATSLHSACGLPLRHHVTAPKTLLASLELLGGCLRTDEPYSLDAAKLIIAVQLARTRLNSTVEGEGTVTLDATALRPRQRALRRESGEVWWGAVALKRSPVTMDQISNESLGSRMAYLLQQVHFFSTGKAAQQYFGDTLAMKELSWQCTGSLSISREHDWLRHVDRAHGPTSRYSYDAVHSDAGQGLRRMSPGAVLLH
ncbi:hypothetical protein WJX81_000842 [Elliptochloris bilobata]|uniref:Uncharacterized protein n=1 Tax=Elliptochloris bilobata TaxID=381761 RepID=A0AAW1SCW9_9CHLO